MSRSLFFGIISLFSKITAAVLLSFSYFAIFSILDVDKNPFTVFGIFLISMFVSQMFYYFSEKVYEGTLLEDIEELIEAAVLEKKERKKFIKNNVKYRTTEMFELNIMLTLFSMVVALLSITAIGIVEFGFSIKTFGSRELVSSTLLSISMLVVLSLMFRIMIRSKDKEKMEFIRHITVNGAFLYFSLLIYVYALFDSMIVLIN